MSQGQLFTLSKTPTNPVWELLMYFEQKLEDITGVRPDLHTERKEKGRQLGGSKRLYQACEEDFALACKVIDLWVEDKQAAVRFASLNAVASNASKLVWQAKVRMKEAEGEDQGYIQRDRRVTL